MDPYLLKISLTKLVVGIGILNGITALLVRRAVKKNTEEEYKRYMSYLLDHMTPEELEIVKLDLAYMRSDD